MDQSTVFGNPSAFCSPPASMVPTVGQDTSLGQNPFLHHPQVRLNEAQIWRYVRREVENTINHLDRIDRIHVLEIGGASLEGLKSLVRSEAFSRVEYTIVDPLAPSDSALVESTGASYIRGVAHDIDISSIPTVHLVIAVRALEYDPNYKTTLRRLSSISSYPAYGIFVHNAEDSKVFRDVRKDIGILQYRLGAYSVAKRLAQGAINVSEALLLCEEKLQQLAVESQCKERRRLLSSMAKLVNPDNDLTSEILRLERDSLIFETRLAQLGQVYGERIASRRFWSTSESASIREMYLGSGVLPLSRVNALLGDSGLKVHIDTGALGDPFAQAPLPIPETMIPEVSVIERSIDPWTME